MESERILCPYCGPWNGHPDGVDMALERRTVIGGITMYGFMCPSCLTHSPRKQSEKEAHAAALRRFTQAQTPLTYEQIKERAEDKAPVYVITGEGKGYWALLDVGEAPGDGGYRYPGGEVIAEDLSGDALDGDFYGLREVGGKPHCLGWIAFDRKPNAREIAAAKWDSNAPNAL